MSKITEERLKRAAFAVERGLLQDIILEDGEYVVYYDFVGGRYPIGTCSTLEGALSLWDDAEAGRILPEDDDDFGGTYREDMMPTWDDYVFDEDGYKRRRE